MKESKTKNKAQHLKNAIKYIFNPEKTEGGLWCGSNCGATPEEIYRSMVQTKKDFGQDWGRQGYHFVISCPPEEDVDEKTLYDLGRRFCREYLGDAWEYCYAVHNDHDHLHCHIVFNSIDRIDGHKYRYVDGDWEKKIQPVTDRLCQELGLAPLVYERKERKRKSYVEHMAEKSGKIVWQNIIRSDIDYACRRADSIEDFFAQMTKQGYQIRQGMSKKHGLYYSFHPPGADRAHRSYKLGEGYQPADIEYKIRHHDTSDPSPLYVSPLAKIKTSQPYQAAMVLRIRQATMYYVFPAEDLNPARVRKDLLKIRQLEEECTYLLKNPLGSVKEAEERLAAMSAAISAEKNRIRAEAYTGALTGEEEDLIQRYQELKKAAEGDLPDDIFEKTLDEMEEMEQTHPDLLPPQERSSAVSSTRLEQLKEQRRILRRLKKDMEEIEKERILLQSEQKIPDAMESVRQKERGKKE